MALSAGRSDLWCLGDEFEYDVKAAAKIFRGSAVVLDSAGNAKEPSAVANEITVGIALATADNSAGLAGAIRVKVREHGVFGFTNSASTDEITKAEFGDVCYWVDGGQVAKTSGSATRSVAGVILGIDGDLNVMVGIGNWALQLGLLAANNLSDVGSAATARANIGANKGSFQGEKISSKASDAEVFRWVATRAGTVTSFRTVLNAALATGDGTVQLKINGSNVGSTTTGLATLTQAASAAGDRAAATPLTTNLTFVAGDLISVTVGGASTATATFNCAVEYTY